MKDRSSLNQKTLFIHRTYLKDEGTFEEYFFGRLQVSANTVTVDVENTDRVRRSWTFADWFLDLFKENAAKRDFEIGSKKVVPDYTVDHTVDLRSKRPSKKRSKKV